MSGRTRRRFESEVELLLAAVREQALGEERDPKAVRAFDGIDWNTVVRLASRHRLLPFVYHYQAAKDLAIPPEVRNEMNERVDALGRRNLYMVSELVDILTRLEEAGVRALTYKGPTLAELAYGDVTLRKFVDLDLLVPEQEFDTARELLSAGKYTVEDSFPTFGETTLRANDTGLTIDLHFSVAPERYPFRFPFDELWERRVAVSLYGRSVETFSPLDLLPIVAVHATKHFWVQLEWLASFTGLILRHSAALPDVLRRARQVGCDRMVLLGLQLSRELLEQSFQEEVSTLVDSDRVVPLISQRVIARTVREDIDYPQRSRSFHYERYLAQLCLMRGLRASAVYGLSIGKSFVKS